MSEIIQNISKHIIFRWITIYSLTTLIISEVDSLVASTSSGSSSIAITNQSSSITTAPTFTSNGLIQFSITYRVN